MLISRGLPLLRGHSIHETNADIPLCRYLGQIVQYMPDREKHALQFGWGLTQGWRDQRKAEDVEFDGLLPGGTGRFSGIIERGMELVGQPED